MATERPVNAEVRRATPRQRPGSAPVAAQPRAVTEAKPKWYNSTKAQLGLMSLAGLAAAYGGMKAGRAIAGTTDADIQRKQLLEYMREQTKSQINQAAEYGRAASYQDSIDRNLANVQQYAPDLYMKVAAGRALPQGAVVLGGSPRQDLLQELGRAMADGRFNR